MSSTVRQTVPCRRIRNCGNTGCPVYQGDDYRCWLVSGTQCHPDGKGAFMDKAARCLECGVMLKYMRPEDVAETLKVFSTQVSRYREKMAREHERLEKMQESLQKFKKTSIYLLKELEVRKQRQEKDAVRLQEAVQQKTEELHEIEDKYLQTAKMMAMGRFSAGLAHEINNPLGAIINFVRTVLANPTVTGEIRGYLELTMKGLFRIENIIKEIQGSPRDTERYKKQTDINELIRGMVVYSKHRLEDKRIRLELHLMDDPPPVRIHAGQIQQVFTNLLHNAVDAVRDGGNITISTEPEGASVIIRVRDDGTGIKRDDLDKIFEPFFTSKEVGAGTGMGLFIAYNILRAHGGRIDVQSQTGRGSIFTVTLPADRHEQGENDE